MPVDISTNNQWEYKNLLGANGKGRWLNDSTAAVILRDAVCFQHVPELIPSTFVDFILLKYLEARAIFS